MLAYAGIPNCITTENTDPNIPKPKTRYKGKIWNTSPPNDYVLWEEICYEYTKHNVERYGIEQVSKWRCHCFNEPDVSKYLISELGNEMFEDRAKAYFAMYEAFVKGVRRVSDQIPVGGPALASRDDFLEAFLERVKKEKTPLDFISLHHYGCAPWELNGGKKKIRVSDLIDKHRGKKEVINRYGFGNTPIVIDEWGSVSSGYKNREDCPMLIFRETEGLAAYYVRLIHDFAFSDMNIEELMICLSGQHEAAADFLGRLGITEAFSGFRSFFALNFVKKPIYNAHVLASKLFDTLLKVECENKNIDVIPTKNDCGEYAVLFSYASEYFEEDIPEIKESISFEEDIEDKIVRVWKIDKETTNPYRLYEKWSGEALSAEQWKILREEGEMKPVLVQAGKEKLDLCLSANGTYLVMVTNE